MANWYIVGLLVAVFLVQRGADSLLLTQTAPNLLVEIGVNNAADTQCFFKKIFKGQASPIQITHTMPAAMPINYVLVDASNSIYRATGITATIVRGAIATAMLTLQVTESSGKPVFLNDIIVTMKCTP
ncbi:uncharacterized protein LOC6053458 [Culex quinquefasciatus]|uniref:uncharacterized protein LOC6053458 n=1 Tax=Culex quinquefasciatus TaxID=7176 RepID=UPI0018E2BAD7|nr:uncharacterized protein LOC6053458 [Culex quinquefasciatus]